MGKNRIEFRSNRRKMDFGPKDRPDSEMEVLAPPAEGTNWLVSDRTHCPCMRGEVWRIHKIQENLILGRATPEILERARAELADRGVTMEDVEVIPRPPPGESTRIVFRSPEKHEYGDSADAHCARCNTWLGWIWHPLNTIFGRTEDQLVMSGRYGMVISGED